MKADRLVLWDIDGTLLHCGSDGKYALNRAFSELYGIANAFDQALIGGAMDSALIEGVHKANGVENPDIKKFSENYRLALIEILDKNKDKRVLPGVVELLDTLNRDPRVINALLTSNLLVGAHSKLEALGLKSYFDIGGYGDGPGDKWDAAERCIQLAERQSGTNFQRKKIFIIGDSCYDIIAAQKSGIMSIAVATGWADAQSLQSCHPNYYFADLSDTNRVLDIIKG